MSRPPLRVAAFVILGFVVASAAWLGLPRRSAHQWRPRLVVLLALDTLRADHLGCYGYARDTSPFIDEMASEGVVFEHAFSQTNRTLGSFASIMTGRYQTSVSEHFTVPEDQPTIASVLQSYGVRTLASTAGGHLNHGFGFARGFEAYEDSKNFASLKNTLPLALGWIDEVAAAPRPTFIFLHGYDVHSPYHKPLVFDGMFDPDYQGTADAIVRSGNDENRIWDGRYFPQRGPMSRPRTRALYEGRRYSVELSEADCNHVVAAYDGAISYADIQVGRLLDHLRARGLADDTLLILIGDHGEQLLEKGFMGHGIDLDDRELHVPLILWAPAALRARRVPQIVELTDLMPTILDFMGLSSDACRGRTLRGLALGDGGEARVAVSSSGAGVSVRDERYRLVQSLPIPPGAPRGYQLVNGLYEASDTAARINLIARPGLAEVVTALQARLQERLPDVQL